MPDRLGLGVASVGASHGVPALAICPAETGLLGQQPLPFHSTVALGPRDDGNGHLVFGVFSYGEHGGADDYGSLVTLELILLNEAEAVLRLEDVHLVTDDAESAPLRSVGDGHIRTDERIYLP